MKTVFVVLERDGDHNLIFSKVRMTLSAAMVAAHDIKPAVVLEMSPKAGGDDKPLEMIEVS